MELMYVLCFLLGWFFCKLSMGIKNYHMLKKLDQELGEKLDKIRERIVPSRIEEVNGSLFLYNSETNEFLGQGKDFAELEKTIRTKYPNKLFNVPQKELDKYE